MDIEELRKTFDGYHVDMSLWPSGGMVTIYGCEECGTESVDMLSASWNIKRMGSIETAINTVKSKMKLYHKKGHN